MTISMYSVSTPIFIRMLENLSAIIDKAAAHAEAARIDPSIFVNARLAPDMYPFSRQVQIATDMVKGCAARLAGIDVPSFADTESTFDELKERIAKTIAFLDTVGMERIDGTEEKEIIIKTPHRELVMCGELYLKHYVLPNFYFHVTTAYAILRHNGVKLGKTDFIGGI